MIARWPIRFRASCFFTFLLLMLPLHLRAATPSDPADQTPLLEDRIGDTPSKPVFNSGICSSPPDNAPTPHRRANRYDDQS